jgi:hypothetical protein
VRRDALRLAQCSRRGTLSGERGGSDVLPSVPTASRGELCRATCPPTRIVPNQRPDVRNVLDAERCTRRRSEEPALGAGAHRSVG